MGGRGKERGLHAPILLNPHYLFSSWVKRDGILGNLLLTLSSSGSSNPVRDEGR